MSGNPWWYSSGNIFYAAGYGLPNCTCYAYGRYAEIRNAFQTLLPTGDAGTWWAAAQNTPGLSTGQVPALGAIICYGDNPARPGHVAIVEEIHSDGSLTISESGYRAFYFRATTVRREDNWRAGWVISYGYQFQGFIYNEYTAQWHAKATGGYEKEDPEAYDNAVIIYSTLAQQGWTLNAVCGLLGNIDAECNYNPWQWEQGSPPASTDYTEIHDGGGYGLVQWTPASKYVGDSVAMQSPYYAPNFSDIGGNVNDGYAQLYAIQNQTGQYSATSEYPLTYDDYRASTQTADYLASAWMYNYEVPRMDTPPEDPGLEQRRRNAALFWYNVLQGVTPGPGPTPPPVQDRKMPLMFYLRSPVIRR